MVISRAGKFLLFNSVWFLLVAMVLLMICTSFRAWSEDMLSSTGVTPAQFEVPDARIENDCVDAFLKGMSDGENSQPERQPSFQVKVKHREASVETPDPIIQSWTYLLGSSPLHQLAISGGEKWYFCTNDRYSFQLEKIEARDVFVLEGANLNDGNEPMLRGPLKTTRDAFDYSRSVWWVQFQFIIDKMQSEKTFHIVSAYYETRDDTKYAKIAWKYTGEFVGNPYCQNGSIYWAECLPDLNWVVTRSGVDHVSNENEDLSILVNVEYQTMFSHAPFPSITRLSYRDSKEGLVEVRETEFSIPEPLADSQQEFYLPYYGISEDVLPTPHSHRRRLLLLLVGFSGVAIAIYLWLRSRKV